MCGDKSKKGKILLKSLVVHVNTILSEYDDDYMPDETKIKAVSDCGDKPNGKAQVKPHTCE